MKTVRDILPDSAFGGLDFLNGDTILESATLDESINGDGGLSLSWKSELGGIIPAGTMVGDYVMMEPYAPSLSDSGIYQWSPRFSEKAALLGKSLFYKVLTMTDGTQQTLYTFSFMGKPSVIIEDLNSFLDGTAWNVQASEALLSQEDAIIVSFDGDSVKSAVQKVADACGANLYFVGVKICIGMSDAYAADEYYNRFVVLGGTRNMAKRTPSGDYYAAITQRLTLDTSQDGVSAGSILDYSGGSAPMTKLLVFDDIYPKLELKITGARERECWLLDENGDKIPDGNGGYKKYSKWYITVGHTDDTAYTFNPTDVIQDKTLGILFQSGTLTGREFELVYFNQDTEEWEKDDILPRTGKFKANAGEFRIILQGDGDLLLPSIASAGLCPKAGDKVTLTNIAVVGEQYITIARNKLLEEGRKLAGILSSNKIPSYSAENRWPDFLTGSSDDVSLGDSVGEEDEGYIVTGVSTDLITGAKSVTYGTYRPKGLIQSLIDKVDGVSLSGGTGTTEEKESSRGSSPIDAEALKALLQAGGNIGMMNLSERVNDVTLLSELESVMGEIGYRLYKVVKDDIEDGRVTVSVKSGNDALDVTVGETDLNELSIESDEKNELGILFTTLHNTLGDCTFNIYGTRPDTPAEHDLLLRPVTAPSVFKNETVANDEVRGTVDGGIEVQMYTNKGWKLVREYLASLIANLSGNIFAFAYGSSGSGGFLAQVGKALAFAEKFGVDENGDVVDLTSSYLVLTNTSGTLKTVYRSTYGDPATEVEVVASIGTSVEPYTENDVTKYRGKLELNADNVAISGDCITFSATNSFTTTVQSLGAIMKGSPDGNGSFSVGYYNNGSLVPVINFIRESNQTKLNLTADNCTLSGELVSISASDAINLTAGTDDGSVGFVASKVSDGTIQMGKFDGEGYLIAGLTFTQDGSDGYKFNLNASNASIDAGSIVFTNGGSTTAVFENGRIKANYILVDDLEVSNLRIKGGYNTGFQRTIPTVVTDSNASEYFTNEGWAWLLYSAQGFRRAGGDIPSLALDIDKVGTSVVINGLGDELQNEHFIHLPFMAALVEGEGSTDFPAAYSGVDDQGRSEDETTALYREKNRVRSYVGNSIEIYNLTGKEIMIVGMYDPSTGKDGEISNQGPLQECIWQTHSLETAHMMRLTCKRHGYPNTAEQSSAPSAEIIYWEKEVEMTSVNSDELQEKYM